MIHRSRHPEVTNQCYHAHPNTRKWPFFGKEAFPSPRSWYCITAYPEVLERKVSKGRELTLCFISGSLRVLEYPLTHMTSFFWGMWELCVGIEDRRGGRELHSHSLFNVYTETKKEVQPLNWWFQQQIDGTRGWISADRRTKPTLTLTIPRSISKSSTEDLSLPTIGITMTYDAGPKSIAIRVASGEVNIVGIQQGFWLRGVQS